MQQNVLEVLAAMEAAVSKIEMISKAIKDQALRLSAINNRIKEIQDRQNSGNLRETVWFPEDSPTLSKSSQLH